MVMVKECTLGVLITLGPEMRDTGIISMVIMRYHTVPEVTRILPNSIDIYLSIVVE